MDEVSNHLPIILQRGEIKEKFHLSFKFNNVWLKEESLKDFVQRNWKGYDSDLEVSPMEWLVSTLEIVKKIMVE